MTETNGVTNGNTIENVKITFDFDEQRQKTHSFDLLSASLPSAVPQYGIKLKLNHKFPEKRTQNIRPTVRQSLAFIPMAWR